MLLMDCAERTRLREEYNVLLARLIERVDGLSKFNTIGKFADAVTAAQETSRDCQNARMLWHAHIAAHQCDRG
jgi:hypothetical protein